MPVAIRNQCRVSILPIIPTVRREAFNGPEWTFELKLDGFRAIADTMNGRMLSKRGNRMHHFEALLGSLPADCVLDGEVVALDEAGRPMFADLMFRRRPPVYVAFDVLIAGGEDVRALPLDRRKAVLKRSAKAARRWTAITDGVPRQGRRLFELVAEMDLKGIVAKRLADPYARGRAPWFKILNRLYPSVMGETWTPKLVLTELRAALTKPRVPPGRSLLPEPDDALPAPDLVALTERWLGRNSLERRALLILAKPGMSIRELCREPV